jgi:hypothetical protein
MYILKISLYTYSSLYKRDRFPEKSFVKNLADFNCTVGSLGQTPGNNGRIF